MKILKIIAQLIIIMIGGYVIFLFPIRQNVECSWICTTNHGFPFMNFERGPGFNVGTGMFELNYVGIVASIALFIFYIIVVLVLFKHFDKIKKSN